MGKCFHEQSSYNGVKNSWQWPSNNSGMLQKMSSFALEIAILAFMHLCRKIIADFSTTYFSVNPGGSVFFIYAKHLCFHFLIFPTMFVHEGN
jgi:hypothetical protein